MAARIGAVVLCMVLIVSAGLVATPTEARAVADVVYAAAATNAAAGGIRRGKWNSARRLEGDAARKREVPGGPDPQHHH
ncbi:hypothetical protein CFC21_042221 [Triticum aestivum]|uniref:Uncharacterized protein n=2 Tax=Triticum aestivum TaxID=4565 RepID=A0A3B6FPQ1_WHEAT|nr:hypothetical protein CFC21_042221 [Triticum aestivum]